MKYTLFIVLFLAFWFSSCKRVCYNCSQYCAYCVLKADTNFITKVCSDGSSSTKVNMALTALTDSGYTCILLNDKQTVCDSKGSITSATNYYQKQDYFCKPEE